MRIQFLGREVGAQQVKCPGWRLACSRDAAVRIQWLISIRVPRGTMGSLVVLGGHGEKSGLCQVARPILLSLA